MNPYIEPDCISVFVVFKSGKDSKYLLLRRCGKYLPGTWQMVTGGIHKGETCWEAVLREIKEETGIIPDKLYSADAVETFYLKVKDKITFVPVFVALVNKIPDIKLAPDEHDNFAWLSVEEASDRLVWAEQKRILSHVHHEFILKEPNAIHEIVLKIPLI